MWTMVIVERCPSWFLKENFIILTSEAQWTNRSNIVVNNCEHVTKHNIKHDIFRSIKESSKFLTQRKFIFFAIYSE